MPRSAILLHKTYVQQFISIPQRFEIQYSLRFIGYWMIESTCDPHVWDWNYRKFWQENILFLKFFDDSFVIFVIFFFFFAYFTRVIAEEGEDLIKGLRVFLCLNVHWYDLNKF